VAIEIVESGGLARVVSPANWGVKPAAWVLPPLGALSILGNGLHLAGVIDAAGSTASAVAWLVLGVALLGLAWMPLGTEIELDRELGTARTRVHRAYLPERRASFALADVVEIRVARSRRWISASLRRGRGGSAPLAGPVPDDDAGVTQITRACDLAARATGAPVVGLG
jgi:hypothetical protein